MRNGERIPQILADVLPIQILVVLNIVGKISPENRIPIIIADIPKNLPNSAKQRPAISFSKIDIFNLKVCRLFMNIKTN